MDDEVQTEEFEVRKDPRISTTQEDFQAQFDLLLQIRDKLSAVHDAVLRSRELRSQVDAWKARLEASGQSELACEAERVAERLLADENNLVESRSTGNADSFNYPPKVNSKLASMQGTVSFGDTRPPEQQYGVFAHLSAQADEHMATLEQVIASDVAALNARILASDVPAIG